MGLVIGITACCCAVCAYKKNREKRKKLQNNDTPELEDTVPGDQTMYRGEIDDVTIDEINTDDPVQAQVGTHRDPPASAGPMPPDEITDTAAGVKKLSSKKYKYSPLRAQRTQDDARKEVNEIQIQISDDDVYVDRPVSYV